MNAKPPIFITTIHFGIRLNRLLEILFTGCKKVIILINIFEKDKQLKLNKDEQTRKYQLFRITGQQFICY